MIGFLLTSLEALTYLYLLITLSLLLWSLLPTRTEIPLEARISWSEAFVASVFWPVTMWVSIQAFSKSLDEEDIQ